jgi:hypothetical protein
MKHLTPTELVDAADGALAADRAAHLDGCAACRSQVAGLTATLAETRGIEAAEPSPLFWDHLSARVREAVAQESIAPRPLFGSFLDGWFGARRLVPAGAGIAAAIAIVAVASLSRHSTAPAPGPAAAQVNAEPAMLWTTAEVNPDDSEVWQVLTSAASEIPIEDAHEAGMSVRPAAIDAAVQRLNPDELRELGRLLQAELKHSGD